MHLGPFCYCIKLDANGQSDAINAKDRATNSHRILSLRTHVIHTMGHKTHVLSHFVLFECIWDRFVTALNSVQNEPNWGNEWKVCATKSRWNFSLWTHPIHTKGPKTHVFLHFVIVWVHLGLFRYCNKLDAKWAELVQLMRKFMSRSRVGTFRYEPNRYTPWDPELMFCCISYCLDAFGTDLLLH